VRAGDKPLPLIDKIAAGKAARILEPANLRSEELLEPAELTGAAELAGEDMPAPGVLKRPPEGRQAFGRGRALHRNWNWLRARGCEKLINPRLVEAYAQAFARFIQCEEAISTYGLLGKHPTTGGAITSPFVQMSQSFQKQANLLWYEIFDVVKQNCTTAFVGNPQDDMMEALLSGRKGR
jgi:hypothetical protein